MVTARRTVPLLQRLVGPEGTLIFRKGVGRRPLLPWTDASGIAIAAMSVAITKHFAPLLGNG